MGCSATLYFLDAIYYSYTGHSEGHSAALNIITSICVQEYGGEKPAKKSNVPHNVLTKLFIEIPGTSAKMEKRRYFQL